MITDDIFELVSYNIDEEPHILVNNETSAGVRAQGLHLRLPCPLLSMERGAGQDRFRL